MEINSRVVGEGSGRNVCYLATILAVVRKIQRKGVRAAGAGGARAGRCARRPGQQKRSRAVLLRTRRRITKLSLHGGALLWHRHMVFSQQWLMVCI